MIAACLAEDQLLRITCLTADCADVQILNQVGNRANRHSTGLQWALVQEVPLVREHLRRLLCCAQAANLAHTRAAQHGARALGTRATGGLCVAGCSGRTARL